MTRNLSKRSKNGFFPHAPDRSQPISVTSAHTVTDVTIFSALYLCCFRPGLDEETREPAAAKSARRAFDIVVGQQPNT